MKHYILLYIAGAWLLSACGRQTSLPVSEAPEKVVKQWLDSAECHLDRREYKDAAKFLNSSEEAVANISTDTVAYRLYSDLAYLHERSGSPKQAIDYQRHALKYAKATKRGRLIVEMLNRQVFTLYKMGSNDSAWAVTQEMMRHYSRANDELRAQMLQHVAYHKMLVDSVDEAEKVLAKACRSSADSTIIPDSAMMKSLYSRLPVENMMLEDLLTLQNKYDTAKIEAEKARQQLLFTWLLTGILLLAAGGVWWYRRQQQQVVNRYESLIDGIRCQMEEALLSRDATIEEMKAVVDRSLQEKEDLKRKLPKTYISSKNNDFIEQTKLGVDVLHAISNDRNISQYGRREQLAVMEVMRIVAPDFVRLLSDASLSLTPKETFFCIMEHMGKSDRQKALSFCCSEQALRSTKSRLGKKLDLSRLVNR